MELYENQFIEDDEVYTKFLFIHDDTFGRTRSYKELKEQLDKMGKEYEINPLSTDDRGKVNVFLIKIKGKYNSEEELPYDAIALNDIRYYSIVPCNFNGR